MSREEWAAGRRGGGEGVNYEVLKRYRPTIEVKRESRDESDEIRDKKKLGGGGGGGR